VRDVAVAGGCKQRKTSIDKTLKLTVQVAAMVMSLMLLAQNTPMKADINCPPIKGQGCASGLVGIISKITIEAPMDARIMG
jgi:hypothetical protein